MELHCHTNFSFLDGASHPEDLAEEARRLGLAALAITDHNGFYGVVRFAEAARPLDLPTVFGTELSLSVTKPPMGVADPPGNHLVVLASGPAGYASLARAISHGQLAGEKGAPRFDLPMLASEAADNWFVLTGCRKGAVSRALMDEGPAAARRELALLTEAFGRGRVLVELWDHGDPLDRHRNDALALVAAEERVDVVATNNVHYAKPSDSQLGAAVAAIRSRRSLDEIDGWIPAAPFAHLRSPYEQRQRFARYPGAIERTIDIANECAFDLRLAAPDLPNHDTPSGHTEMTWLRELTMRGAAVRYPTTHPKHDQAMRQIDYELGVIEQLNFPGYFLVVYEIVEFCRRNNIYCQGRGSAANSAVCYALGITNADAVDLELLFERFISPERDGPPDIDVDIEHQRREEVIQYVYECHGRERAAQVANVITYRARSAVREAAKAVGLSSDEANAISRWVDRWGSADASGLTGAPKRASFDGLDDPAAPEVPELALELASKLADFPRHLGIHSGGMVLADRPLVEVCPIEWARMEDRSVLQWDKDDCAAAGLVKFDLLGLGMLTVLHRCVDLIRGHQGVEVDLATIPQEDEVYDMLCAADTVGVFQVESRAQMATLPRLRPRTFYDLVIEVALIRPGPIQGKSVHPYLRRRSGEEKVTYPHPLLEPALKKTLGVPLFQEQLMQIAIDAAGFTPAEADQLRQAMGSKRSRQRMAKMRIRLMEGMASKGIVGETAEEIASKLEAFADFGFPESHSVSFAYIVYSSAWMKLRYPTEFTVALLNSQPMGFYSPHTLVRDADRHGVKTLGPCVNSSSAEAIIEAPMTLRLGLSSIKGLATKFLRRIETERAKYAFSDLADFARRTEPAGNALDQLSSAGAFDCFGVTRREALWAAGPLRYESADRLPDLAQSNEIPMLPGMSEFETAMADLSSMSISPDSHPTQFLRSELKGVVTSVDLKTLDHGTVIEVVGVVNHRQQPPTANGVTFIDLEDETGLINVICVAGVWKRYRGVARTQPMLRIRGILERHQGVINLLAQKITACRVTPNDFALKSRDFR